MPNDTLRGVAETLADEIHTVDVRIEGLAERRLHLTRALDALRLLGIDTADTEPPTAKVDPVERKRTRASSATKRVVKKTPAHKKRAPKPKSEHALTAPDASPVADASSATAARRGRPPKYPPDEVVAVALAAKAAGTSMAVAVSERFGCTLSTASGMVDRAR
jgi:hypothetical protein